MLMPHPETLRKLVEEYEALVAQEAADSTGRLGQRAQDLAYTLCVSTGTRDVQLALAAARRQLATVTGLPATQPKAACGTALGRRVITKTRQMPVGVADGETPVLAD
ncbi:DUF5133 domain-containing protein [Streptomyces sp. NPDC059785]|uniref:DUF5133 domain-containing protein n=1 Tax=unclassified Streptomyces TaxID=2593676 RepID=UPI0036555B4E